MAQEIYETLSFRSLTQTSKKPVPGQGMPHGFFSSQELIKLLTVGHYATSAVVIPLNQDYALTWQPLGSCQSIEDEVGVPFGFVVPDAAQHVPDSYWENSG